MAPAGLLPALVIAHPTSFQPAHMPAAPCCGAGASVPWTGRVVEYPSPEGSSNPKSSNRPQSQTPFPAYEPNKSLYKINQSILTYFYFSRPQRALQSHQRVWPRWPTHQPPAQTDGEPTTTNHHLHTPCLFWKPENTSFLCRRAASINSPTALRFAPFSYLSEWGST